MINQNQNNLDNDTLLLNDDNSIFSQCPIVNNKNNSVIDLNIEHLHNKDTTDIINQQTLTFATHNVHGLNNNVKNKQIIDSFILQQIDFVGLTETHHRPLHELQCKDQDFYDTF